MPAAAAVVVVEIGKRLANLANGHDILASVSLLKVAECDGRDDAESDIEKKVQ